MTGSRQVPWARVFVEGVVIVGSILLAFAIDAWWDRTRERAEEASLLIGLTEDLRTSRSEVESVVSTYERNARLLSRLTSLSEAELRSDEPDSITAMITALASPRTFDPTLGTLDALISAGKMNLLSDPDLREALISLRNMVDDAREEEAYVSHFAVRVWEAEVSHGGPWRADVEQLVPGGRAFTDLSIAPVATADDALRLREDAELMSLSRFGHVNGAMYIGELRGVLREIDSLLAVIGTGMAAR